MTRDTEYIVNCPSCDAQSEKAEHGGFCTSCRTFHRDGFIRGEQVKVDGIYYGFIRSLENGLFVHYVVDDGVVQEFLPAKRLERWSVREHYDVFMSADGGLLTPNGTFIPSSPFEAAVNASAKSMGYPSLDAARDKGCLWLWRHIWRAPHDSVRHTLTPDQEPMIADWCAANCVEVPFWFTAECPTGYCHFA